MDASVLGCAHGTAQHVFKQRAQPQAGETLVITDGAGVAAKHAVVGMTKTAALEYARHNIRVNANCPYYSPTPLVTESNFNDRRDMLEKGSPMKRLGERRDRRGHAYADGPGNSYINGQAVAVDGGISAR